MHITLYFIIFHIHVLFAKHSVIQIFGRKNINILNKFECTSEFSGKNKLLKVLCYENLTVFQLYDVLKQYYHKMPRFADLKSI